MFDSKTLYDRLIAGEFLHDKPTMFSSRDLMEVLGAHDPKPRYEILGDAIPED